jgi:SAM-dependent methyltransferase
MKTLYTRLLKKALEHNLLQKTSLILVVGGGPNDSKTLQQLGFKNVIISNLVPHANYTNYYPYKWENADLNNLQYQSDSFDFVIVSASLHHLYSPHRGLIEMLRVSKNAIMIIESSDNLLSKISRKLGLVPNYEIDAILGDGTGGVENSSIPNFIYRWTRDEVKKAVNSFLPHTQNKFYFYHHYQFPIARLKRSKNLFVKLALPLVYLTSFLLKLFFPRQANEFGILIEKGKILHPWLKGTRDNPLLNLPYLRKHYKTNL